MSWEVNWSALGGSSSWKPFNSRRASTAESRVMKVKGLRNPTAINARVEA